MKQKSKISFIILSILVLFVMTLPCQVMAKKTKMPKKQSYVGPTRCDGSCHDPWYQAWKDSPHGKTYDLLKPGTRAEAKKKANMDPSKDYTADPACLRCHTTGYRQSGGFKPGKTFIDPEEPNLEQVGCEMCHSMRGGSQYRIIMKNTDGKFKRTEIEKHGYRYDRPNVCYRCHEHPKNPHNPSLDAKYKRNYEEAGKTVHEYKKYYNEDNKDQTWEIEHGHGVTEDKDLVIEDWGFKDGKLKFKKGTKPLRVKKGVPHYDGTMVFK